MINFNLADNPVNCDKFDVELPLRPSLFLGFILKNEYDNQRLEINEKYKPRKFLRICEENKKLDVVPLYGLCLELNEEGKKITKILTRQEKINMNLVIYENILSQFNLTCDDCYGYFRKGLYPIDFNKFRYLTDNEASKDKKILQHMLSLDDNKFDFQKFGSIISLLLI